MKSILTTFILFLFIGGTIKAQNIVFIFSAPEGEEIIKIDEDLHQKSVEFFVTGLNNVDEVSAFVQKISEVKGVKSFTISEELIDGKRAASGVFDGCVSLDFFKKFLLDAGVYDLIINDEPLKSEDLHTVWKSKKTEENPTKPMHDLH